MTSPALSILCPVYNALPFLTELLTSLRRQTARDWEAILVDDGSRDESQAVLAETIRADVRFRVIAQRNAGICGARNRALEALRGRAFMHLDQDDILPPYAVEVLEQGARESGAALVVGRMCPFSETPPPLDASPGYTLLEGARWREELIAAITNPLHGGLAFPSWNKRYDRAAFGTFRFLPVRYGDDTYYTPLTHLAVSRACLLNAVTYFWRTGHTSGSCGTCSPVWIAGYAQALAQAAALPIEPRFRRAYHRALMTPFKWVGHTLIRFWIAPGTVRRNAEAAQAIREVFAVLLPRALELPLKWRLRLWVMRRGWWRLAQMLCRK